MKVFVKFNIGTNDSKFPPLQEGEQEVDDAVGEAIVKSGYAEMRGEAVAPEQTGLPAVSPMKDFSAAEAIELIASESDVSLLNLIASLEHRKTVKEAAEERLVELQS